VNTIVGNLSALKTIILLTVMCFVLPFACEEKSTDTGNGHGVGRYLIETQPSLSFDHTYVYYIATDTVDTSNNGIYRAQVKKPIRERVFAGQNLRSPTVSPDNQEVAYLKSGVIWFYNIDENSHATSSVSMSFQSIAYVSDMILVGQRQDSIHVISKSDDSVTFLASGWDPSPLTRDTVLYVVPIVGQAYGIVKSDMSALSCDTMYYVSVIDNFGYVRWPSFDRQSNRLTWILTSARGHEVFAAEIGQYPPHIISGSLAEKPLILNFDKIIYTGPDGRFYESNYFGTDKGPFWYAEE